MAQSNLKEEIRDFTNVLTGGQTKSKQLYFQLKNSIDKAKRIDIIVSFLIFSKITFSFQTALIASSSSFLAEATT